MDAAAAARPPPLLRRRSRQSGSRRYRDKLCFLIFRPADFSRRTAAHYHPSTSSHGPGFPPRSVPGKRRPPPPHPLAGRLIGSAVSLGGCIMMMALVGHGVIIFSIFSGHPPAHPQPFPHNVKCSLLRGSLVCAPCGWSRLSSLRQADKDAADAAAHHLICHTAARDQSRANCAAPREAALTARKS